MLRFLVFRIIMFLFLILLIDLFEFSMVFMVSFFIKWFCNILMLLFNIKYNCFFIWLLMWVIIFLIGFFYKLKGNEVFVEVLCVWREDSLIFLLGKRWLFILIVSILFCMVIFLMLNWVSFLSLLVVWRFMIFWCILVNIVLLLLYLGFLINKFIWLLVKIDGL